MFVFLQYYLGNGNGGLSPEPLTQQITMDFDEGVIEKKNLYLVSTVPITCTLPQKCEIEYAVRTDERLQGGQQTVEGLFTCKYKYVHLD